MGKPAKVGRKTIMTEDIVDELENAFKVGCTDVEACFLANISPATLYNYQEKHPEFLERKEALKSNPVILARQSVNKAMQRDGKLAMDYLKSKKADEFHSGSTTVVDARQINIYQDVREELRQIIDAK